MTVAALSIEALAAEGLAILKRDGRVASEIATELIRDRWADLAKSDQQSLAATGLAVYINDEVADERTAPTPGISGATNRDYKKVFAEHEAIDCDSVSHDYSGPRGHESRLRCLSNRAFLAERGKEPVTRFSMLGDLLTKVRPLMDAAVEEEVQKRLGGIRLIASNGKMKSLLKFNANDVSLWKERSETMTASWSARREWFDEALAAMTKTGSKTIGDLPLETKGRLSERAADVWVSRKSARREQRTSR